MEIIFNTKAKRRNIMRNAFIKKAILALFLLCLATSFVLAEFSSDFSILFENKTGRTVEYQLSVKQTPLDEIEFKKISADLYVNSQFKENILITGEDFEADKVLYSKPFEISNDMVEIKIYYTRDSVARDRFYGSIYSIHNCSDKAIIADFMHRFRSLWSKDWIILDNYDENIFNVLLSDTYKTSEGKYYIERGNDFPLEIKSLPISYI